MNRMSMGNMNKRNMGKKASIENSFLNTALTGNKLIV